MTPLPLVVGGLIVDRYPDFTCVLAARRTRPPALAGLWEFPGGKVEPGETPEVALVRELQEELSIDVKIRDELRPPSGDVWPASAGHVMRLYFVTTTDQAEPQDGHDAVRWVSAAELSDIEWLASDREAARLLHFHD